VTGLSLLRVAESAEAKKVAISWKSGGDRQVVPSRPGPRRLRSMSARAVRLSLSAVLARDASGPSWVPWKLG